MTQHTQGPWQHRPFSDMSVDFINAAGQLIGEVSCFDVPHAEMLANLQLILAAPDLLAACRAALVSLTEAPEGDPAVARILQDAIAKCDTPAT